MAGYFLRPKLRLFLSPAPRDPEGTSVSTKHSGF